MIENAHTLLVDTPAPTHPNRKRWSKELLQALDEHDPADVQQASVELLDEIPFALISHNLGRIAADDCETSRPINDLVFLRRLCMVARDGILLTSPDEQKEPLVPLRNLCRTLGQVVDSKGADDTALPYARDCADGIAVEGLPPVRKPVSSKRLHSRVAATVTVDISTKPKKPSSVDDYHGYHDQRKDLRAGTHVALLLALLNDTQDPTTLALALEGKAINEKFGKVKNRLYRQSKKLSK